MASDTYVIVTTWNILWVLLSVSAPLATIAGILTPNWLIGTMDSGRHNFSIPLPPNLRGKPSIGIINHCIHFSTTIGGTKKLRCMYYGSDFSDIACDEWKASVVFLMIGTAVLSVVVFMALVGFCIQSIGRKSLFTIGGLVQAIGGLFLIIGLVLYPAGWGNSRIQSLCAKPYQKAEAFVMNECSFGWAFYATVGGTVAAFLCSFLATQAEKSTSSDKVQDKILEGSTCICLL